GGIAGYSKAMMKHRINKSIEQITLVAANLRTTFGSQHSYSGASSTNVLVKAKIVSDEMIPSGWLAEIQKAGKKSLPGLKATAEFNRIKVRSDSFRNVFGGDFIVGETTGGDFSIEITNIPQEACITLATQDWGRSAGLTGYYVNSAPALYYLFREGVELGCSSYQAENYGAQQCPGDGPMGIDVATEACFNKHNSLTWYFY
ncbi:MAG: hypothetical protein ILA52_01255, partial [Alphaproteobacteria bacterium]|nr:hypothetical protein [Alphaproteobacteria bacterium]